MNVEYSGHYANCQNIFGCLGLRNKQYIKEQYEFLVSKIKQHIIDIPYVDKKGNVYKYGEFFPMEISIFPYNDTTAQDYFDLTKEEILNSGYSWIDNINRNYSIDINAETLPDNITDTPRRYYK